MSTEENPMSRTAIIGAGPCGLAQLHAFEQARLDGADVGEVSSVLTWSIDSLPSLTSA